MIRTMERGSRVRMVTGWRLALVCAALFVCLMVCYTSMMPDGEFCDELDVFSGGYLVSRGCDVYYENLSQHMPFSYYFAAIPALLGARSTIAFRLSFYAMLSLLWVGNFLHHRRHLSPLLLLSLPFLYLAQLRVVSLATNMLSDHWCGMGIAFLLLEVLRYADTGRIPRSSAVWIALDIVLSFGTAFVAAYAVAAVFVGVCAMQAVRLRRADADLRRKMLGEDVRLVAICLAPFAVLILWYLVSGNLTRAFEGAYLINTQVYSKYMGGFGSSAGGALAQMLTGFVHAPLDALRGLSLATLTGDGFTLLRYAAILAGVVILVCRKKPGAALTLLATAAMAGARGYDGFHAMAFFCVSAVSMALCVSAAVAALARRPRRLPAILPAAAVGVCVAALLAPMAIGFARAALTVPRRIVYERADDRLAAIVRLLNEDDEPIQNADLGTGTLYFRAGVRTGPYSGAATTPWTWGYFGQRQLRAIQEDPPRMVFYTPGNVIWDYAEDEYAAELVEWLDAHYTRLYTSLMVRNEDYDDALARVEAAGLFIGREGDSFGSGETVSGALAPQEEVVQRFVAEGGACIGVDVRMANFSYRNTAGLTLRLTDAQTGEELASAHIARDDIRDNEYCFAPFAVELEAGHAYDLHLIADETGRGKTALAVYLSSALPGEGGFTRDGEVQDCDLAMRLFYRVEKN